MSESKDNPATLRIVLLVVIFISLLVGYYFRLAKELSAQKLIKLQAVVVSLDSAVIPMLVFVPTIFVLLAGLIKRRQGKLPEKEVTRGIKFIASSLPLFLLVWGIYSWQQNRWLESANYQKCQFLTASNFGAPTVWVKDSAYCIQGAHRISGQLVAWAGEEAHTGNDISVDEYKNKISELRQPTEHLPEVRAPGD